ncbi:MAG: AAA family ATPase [Sphaerochaeta sp.]|nr:AAA family ATPase [Sphaerochaeta sp.]
MIIDSSENYKLWDQFLAEWPVDRVRSMTLADYSSAGSKNSFTYWIENKLDQMGSIWGGSSFKFGIYSRNETQEMVSKGNRLYNNEYGWLEKYGTTPEEAFIAVKDEVLKTITAVKSGNLEQIDDVDLGHAYKWKIAFHYQDRDNPVVLPVYKLEMLLAVIKSDKKIPTSEIYRTLLSRRPKDKDLLAYGRELWTEYSGMPRIWKVSHGRQDFTSEERKALHDRLCITVHRNTGKSQGDAFAEEMNPGDYFYLCHGNDQGVVLFGRILTEATTGNKGEGWLERSYQIIKELDSPRRYTGVNKGWAPNNNSTVKKVKPNELNLFEEQILKKYFDMELSKLDENFPSSPETISVPKIQEPSELETLDLNIIYYGPPGTGKTFKLLSELTNKYFLDKATPLSKSERAMLIVESNDLTWWQATALSLLDIGEPSKVARLREHPILQAKIKISSSKQPANQIWAHLQTHTQSDCQNVKYSKTSSPQLFWKDEMSQWSISRDMVESQSPELLELLSQYQNEETQLNAKRFVFTTFHQSFSYEDFVEGIKPLMDNSIESDLSYQIEAGIFKRIALRAATNPDKKYAIFIDEINRGNIASIFGELITLIEPDKRKGGKHEVTVTLPYSKEPFAVPMNLHIIGTMNTADRSIIALDSALRRRFKFIECSPEPELINQPNDLTVDLQEMFRVINQRITMILDRDHCIGHSYFMEIASAPNSLNALRDVFSRDIIPLLEEYFSGDLARVGMILGERFVQPLDDVNASTSLAPGTWDTAIEPKDVYVLVDIADLGEEDFASIYENA